MRYDTLYLWYLADPAAPRYVGVLQLVAAGKGVSLRYGQEWLETGFPLSEDLPLIAYRRTYRPDRDDGEASSPSLHCFAR